MRSERAVQSNKGWTLRLYFNTTNHNTPTELTEAAVERALQQAGEAFATAIKQQSHQEVEQHGI